MRRSLLTEHYKALWREKAYDTTQKPIGAAFLLLLLLQQLKSFATCILLSLAAKGCI